MTEGGGGGKGGGGAGNRPRLLPWLKRHLDEGSMPGLQWLDKTAGKFKITWMHGGNQSWSADRYPIFQEWSRETGKFRPGIDREDKTIFKDRLRNALNKARNIEEVKAEHRSENAECYRVYRFVNPGEEFTPDEECLQRIVTHQDMLVDVPVCEQFDGNNMPLIPLSVEGLNAASLPRSHRGQAIEQERVQMGDIVDVAENMDHSLNIDSEQLLFRPGDANLSFTEALSSGGEFEQLPSAELGLSSVYQYPGADGVATQGQDQEHQQANTAIYLAPYLFLGLNGQVDYDFDPEFSS